MSIFKNSEVRVFTEHCRKGFVTIPDISIANVKSDTWKVHMNHGAMSGYYQADIPNPFGNASVTVTYKWIDESKGQDITMSITDATITFKTQSSDLPLQPTSDMWVIIKSNIK